MWPVRKLVNISPSTLDQYRNFYEEEMRGYVDKARMVEYLTGEYVKSEQASFGDCYHRMIEEGPAKFYDPTKKLFVVHDPETGMLHEFTDAMVKPIVEYRRRNPGGVYEVKTRRFFDVGGYRVYSSMRVDHLWGLHIKEQKTTQSRYKPTRDKYYNSVQWRLYLLSLPEAQLVEYNIFHIKRLKRGTSVDYIRFEFLPEAGMELYVTRYMQGLISFCEANGLMDSIRPSWIIEMEQRLQQADDSVVFS